MIRRPTGSPNRREAVSLLEVIVSVTIFLLSISALAQLIRTSSQQSHRVERESLAMQICQTKMNEVAAGVIDLVDGGGELLESEDLPEGFRGWEWNMTATQMDSDVGVGETVTGGPANVLWKVVITVSWPRDTQAAGEVSLTQIVLSPEAKGTTADAANIEGDSDESDLPEDEEGTENNDSN